MVQLADRVKFSTNTTGQGTTIAVGSAESGYQSVPSSLDGKTLRIVIEEGNAWEISTAVYGHSASEFTSRTLTSSSTGALLNLSGSAKVFISPAAEDIYPINTVLVTVSAGKFVIDGTSQQALSLMQSITYRFDQSNSTNSSHPLKFSTTSNGTHNSGSAYTTGVTVVGTAGSAGAYVEIKLEQDAPSTLYYYCGNHSGMGGSITVGAASSGIALTDLSVTQNAASGTGTLSYNNSSGVFSYTPPAETSASGGILEPIKETEIIASNNQTSFPVAYAVGNIAVFLNGSKLGAADFTATNGTSVDLATGATLNDLVEVVEYGAPFAAPYKSSIYTANGSSPFNTGNTILTAAYTQGKEGVYVNGVKLLSGTDYTTNTAGDTITFISALSTNDKVELIEHGALADAASAFTDLTDTPSSLGTAGQVAQVNSAGNALEFADASGGGSWNLISTTTVSSAVASVDFTSIGSYNRYVLLWDCETNGAQNGKIQIYDNGSLLTSSNYVMQRSRMNDASAFATTTSGWISTNGMVSQIGRLEISVAAPRATMEMMVGGLLSTGDTCNTLFTHGGMKSTYSLTTVDGIRFTTSTGTAVINSGRVSLYGLGQ